jgi:O-acetyl-ADP-ribose deacetylase (regulator of RNase III)
MPVVDASGDMFTYNVGALVNPVNTVGIMGGGLALLFARKFPAMLGNYQRACASGALAIGTVHVWTAADGQRVVNLPTKRHWKAPSKLEDVSSGVKALSEALGRMEVRSVAIPALGCGLGGLEWDDVYPIITSEFVHGPVTAYVFAPQ